IDLNGQPHDYSSANKGTLVLQPDSPTASIGIEGGAGTYQVTDQAFDRIGDGFGSLIIGRADGQHVIDIQGLSPKTDTTIRTPAGSINVNFSVHISTRNVNLTLDSPDGVTVLNAGISTRGGDLTFTGPVILGSAASISITTFPNVGHVTFGGPI